MPGPLLMLRQSRLVSRVCCCSQLHALSPRIFNLQLQSKREYKAHVWPYLKELYARRMKAGPADVTPRQSQLNWNYDVELSAFIHRVSENVSKGALAQACLDRDYDLSMRQLIDSSLDSEQAIPDEMNNYSLAIAGRELTEHSLSKLLTAELPNLPDDGIMALMRFLMTDEKLSHVACGIGLDDLVLVKEFPATEEQISKAFLAFIHVLSIEQGEERAETFIRDFILTQLIPEDIDEIYHISNAMTKLEAILQKEGRGEPEPRLIGQYGQDTLLSCYYVGIYSDKELIGKAPGETLDIAEDMAARDALMTIYGIQDFRRPMNFNNSNKRVNQVPQSIESAV